MNASQEHDRAHQDRVVQQGVEREVKRLAEQLLVQVNKVNEIARLLVARIEADGSGRENGRI